MAKTRLTNFHRGRIEKFGLSLIQQRANEQFLPGTLQKDMEKYVRARLKEEFPSKDIAVLQRYGFTRSCKCIRVSLDGNSAHIKQFEFDEEIVTPQKPRNSYSCNDALITVSGDLAKRWFDGITAKENYIQSRTSDYTKLVRGCNTFEDVVAVFPAADSLRSAICVGSTKSLIVINDAVIRRIREDSDIAEKSKAVAQ